MKRAIVFLTVSCGIAAAAACGSESTGNGVTDGGSDAAGSGSGSGGSSSGASSSSSGSSSGGSSGGSSSSSGGGVDGGIPDAGIQCASKANCADGGANQVCCGIFSMTGGAGSACQAAPCAAIAVIGTAIQLCATSAECVTGTCQPPSGLLASFLPPAATYCQGGGDAGGGDSGGGDAGGGEGGAEGGRDGGGDGAPLDAADGG